MCVCVCVCLRVCVRALCGTAQGFVFPLGSNPSSLKRRRRCLPLRYIIRAGACAQSSRHLRSRLRAVGTFFWAANLGRCHFGGRRRARLRREAARRLRSSHVGTSPPTGGGASTDRQMLGTGREVTSHSARSGGRSQEVVEQVVAVVAVVAVAAVVARGWLFGVVPLVVVGCYKYFFITNAALAVSHDHLFKVLKQRDAILCVRLEALVLEERQHA